MLKAKNADFLSSHPTSVPRIRYLAVVSMDKLRMTCTNSRQMPPVSGIKTNYITWLSPRVPLLTLWSNLFNDTIARLWNRGLSSLLLRIPGALQRAKQLQHDSCVWELQSWYPNGRARDEPVLLVVVDFLPGWRRGQFSSGFPAS